MGKTTTFDDLVNRLIQYYAVKPVNPSRGLNISPKIWGPPGWEFLDNIVKAYPRIASPRDKAIMVNFLMSLGNVLPCERCRVNFLHYITDVPPVQYVSGRTKLRKWFLGYKKQYRA